MHIDHLFEKGDQVKYGLLWQLKKGSEGQSDKQLQGKVGVSSATLTKYIREIQEDAGVQSLPFDILEEGGGYQLAMADQSSWADVLYYFYQNSVKLQILTYLLQNKQFSINLLADTLTISQATLNRHLASLNQLLEEFSVQIKNGQLEGPEQQIRYFYFHLFAPIQAAQAIRKRKSPLWLDEHTLTLKQQTNRRMTAYQQDKLSLWLAISQERNQLKNPDWQHFKRLVQPLQSSLLYKRLYQQILQEAYFKNHKKDEAEALLAFLMSFAVIDIPLNEKILGFGGPISVATGRILRFLRQELPQTDYLNERNLYLFSQLLAQLYFFKGHIRPESSLAKVRAKPESQLDYHKTRELLRDIYESLFKRGAGQSNGLLEEVSSHFHQAFENLLFEEPRHVKIGVDLVRESLYPEILLYEIKEGLAYHQLLDFEFYQEGVGYDLVITDYPHASYQNLTYVIKDDLSNYDLNHLLALIESLLKEAGDL